MAIQLLDEQVIAQIAAGEVIERPASVVKELVENSLDAGATHVYVYAQQGGRQLLRISDNGLGIEAEEIELSLTRHATSKLRRVEDLDHLKTLGFRGEALASIAAVSQLTLITCHRDEEMGTSVRLEGGVIQERRAVGAPAGTVITIQNLFYNTPARLKFLKSDNTERRHITSVVMNYALAYPHVAFVLEQDGRETLRTHGTGQLEDALVAIFGVDEFKQMVAVDGESQAPQSIHVWGFCSIPDFNRGDRTRILLFVNGRAIQDSKLTYAVVQAYHTFLMNGRYPVGVLMIEMPPEDLDVNVHPAKAEVRFRDPNRVFSAVQRAVRQAVVQSASPLSDMRSSSLQQTTAIPPVTNSGRVLSDKQLDMPLELEDAGVHGRQRDLIQSYEYGEENLEHIPEGLGQPKKPRTLPLLRVVGQLAASYIVTEGPAGMYLVDQHAAHERVLYEQFMAAYHETEETLSQQVLAAQTLQLSPLDAKLLEEHLPILETVGFQLEPFGGNMFTVRAVPAMLADIDPQAVVASIISDLAMGDKPGEQSIEDRIVKRICKQVAVKAGQVLSREEMQGLIRQLERCESPHTCPHGRPTILHLSADQLAKEFGRLGKR